MSSFSRFGLPIALATLCFPVSLPAASPADQTLGELAAGNARFIAGKPARAFEPVNPRETLAKAARPSTIILSCSDSRVPPELVFDQDWGALYVVRVAGNVASGESVASIEQAVEHLDAHLIVVLGHESCDAVRSAVEAKLGKSAGSPDLDAMVATIKPNLSRRNPSSADVTVNDPTLRSAVMQNVDGVAEELAARSRIIRRRVRAGELKIVRAIYDRDSGKVDFWLPPTSPRPRS